MLNKNLNYGILGLFVIAMLGAAILLAPSSGSFSNVVSRVTPNVVSRAAPAASEQAEAGSEGTGELTKQLQLGKAGAGALATQLQVARSLTIVFNVVLTYIVLGESTSSKVLCSLVVVCAGFFLGSACAPVARCPRLPRPHPPASRRSRRRD